MVRHLMYSSVQIQSHLLETVHNIVTLAREWCVAAVPLARTRASQVHGGAAEERRRAPGQDLGGRGPHEGGQRARGQDRDARRGDHGAQGGRRMVRRLMVHH